MSALGQAVAETPAERKPPARKPRWTPVSALEFVGCDSCRMTLAEYESYPEDGRKIEFFDSAAGLAWMARDAPTEEHERPARMLTALARLIAAVRGSPAECCGAAQLRLLDPDVGQVRAMHPDEMVFLHPERVRPGRSGYFKTGEDTYPDVVLEVDHTTDVRGEKLNHYEEWGFPELWVEVPDAYSRSRPAGLRPGLRIYLLEGGKYVLSEESRAFPGWRADEIHRALNEKTSSAETLRTVNRVGLALGEREGTGPDDDPLLGLHRAEGRVEGRAEGRVEGRAEGRAEARIESRAATARAILGSRRVPVSPEFPGAADRDALGAASEATVVSAASAATSEADFLARLREVPPSIPERH